MEQSNEIRALELKNTELAATVYRLESIIQTHIEEEKDTLSAETQTEETVSSMVEKDEELKLRKEHVDKLKNDIKDLKYQYTEQQLRYNFEISEMRCDNIESVVMEENIQLEQQIEALSSRIMEKENEIENLEFELERKKKEIAGMARLAVRTATGSTEPDLHFPMDEDVQVYKQKVEFVSSSYKSLMDQIDNLELDHQREINDHVKIEAELTKEKTNAEETCKDYLEDIRLSVNYPHNASAYLQTNGLRHEEELINCGLKKLAIRLKGTFDISLCNSPKKSRENDSNACKNSSVVHLYHFEAKTVKSVNKNINKFETKGSKTSKKDEKRRQHQRGKSKDINEKQQESGDLNVQKNFEVYHAANYVDPKLSESYCPNKIIEWKGSWTLPVFLPKSKSKLKHTSSDNFDRTTHLHDGDSNFLQTSKNKTMDQEPCTSMVSTLCTMALGKQFVVLLFIVGSLCGFSLVSLCIRQLFGNQLLDILLKPRPKEYRITKYFNYVGNQIVHIITTIFDKLGKVLVLPSHKLRNTRVCYRCTKSTSTYETEGILNLSMRSLELCRLEELMHDYLCDYLVSDFSCQECNSTMTIVNKRRVVVEPEVLVIALKRYICNERMEP
nr:unnamed protein product [Callosobruchus chinensis]